MEQVMKLVVSVIMVAALEKPSQEKPTALLAYRKKRKKEIARMEPRATLREWATLLFGTETPLNLAVLVVSRRKGKVAIPANSCQ
jgi:hypothetical protein